ncbi:MAG: RNA methyltransferase [Chloroflexi bacterium]|nr:RNA methyltransferase [Chloroflexota bacterium]OJV94829.1 MAG: rRNA methyltransferase [Chloroflexi bacterium 54-19]
MYISSRANPLIKQVRQLRQRKYRDETGLFYVEGIRLVVEALKSGNKIENLLVAPELLTSQFAHDFLKTAGSNGLNKVEVSREVFESFALKENPQGLAAVLKAKWSSLPEVDRENPEVILALNEIQDPGNLGSIIRTADAVGLDTLALLGNCTDPYDPVAIRASMGAVFTQNLIKMSFEELAAWTAGKGIQLIGASGNAQVNYRAASYPRPLVLLMGSEQHGLSNYQQAACDMLVSIPMKGRSDSLNLAIATSIILYEVFSRQNDSVVSI